jgi:hypothetical protein
MLRILIMLKLQINLFKFDSVNSEHSITFCGNKTSKTYITDFGSSPNQYVHTSLFVNAV